MVENEDFVIEEQTDEILAPEAPTPQNIPTTLLEEMRDLKASIKLLTSKLDDSTKEDSK